MRAPMWLFASMMLVACDGGEVEPAVSAGGSGGMAGSTGSPDAGADDAGPGLEPLGPPLGAAAKPTKLAEDVVMVLGVTSDDWVIYRSSLGVVATRADGSSAKPTLISDKVGMVHVRGKVVFVFADVDWKKNLGTLTVWTAADGAKPVGTAVYGEESGFASDDGSWLGFIGNVDELAGTADVILTSPTLEAQQVALPGIGMASDKTCAARIGFVGKRLFATWCKPGSTSAVLQTLDPPEFEPSAVKTGLNSTWSSDSVGKTVFFTDLSGGAWVNRLPSTGDPGSMQKLDNGVGWGTLFPDGSAVLYTVGDQLRRSPTDKVAPTTIITTGFAGRAALSPDLSYALYSTQITYETGTRRNLLLTPTDGLNTSPMRLLDEPTAEISRSAFTADGKWVVYLIAGANDEKTLHVRSVKTPAAREVNDVDTVIAGVGSRLIYSTNRSGPETYPITADLMVMDPSAAGEPVALQQATTDGRSFYLSNDDKRIFFAMPAKDATPSALYAQDLP